jgi:hypothetical protein
VTFPEHLMRDTPSQIRGTPGRLDVAYYVLPGYPGAGSRQQIGIDYNVPEDRDAAIAYLHKSVARIMASQGHDPADIEWVDLTIRPRFLTESST